MASVLGEGVEGVLREREFVLLDRELVFCLPSPFSVGVSSLAYVGALLAIGLLGSLFAP